MAHTLDHTSPDFEAEFAALLAAKREVSEDVDAAVRDIVRRVRDEGDAALAAYSKEFDRLDLSRTPLRIGEDEIDAATASADPATVDALKLAHERIRANHERQKPRDAR
jgi:histidinol dehydrogenase